VLDNYTLEAKKINKTFKGTQAIKEVSFSLRKGEILGLVGENGAGKTTVIKVIGGVEKKDSGSLALESKEYSPQNVQDAVKQGVTIVYQEQQVVLPLTVAENIYLGRLNNFKKCGVLQWKTLYKETEKLIQIIGAKFLPNDKLSNLSYSERKLVDFIRAISSHPKVLLVDEITAILSGDQAKIIMRFLKELSNQGTSIIYVSHRLEEIFYLCKKVIVMKDGNVVAEIKTGHSNPEHLSSLMVGRKIGNRFDIFNEKRNKYDFKEQEKILSVSALEKDPYFSNISFELHKKEILGFAGLEGCGSEQILKSIAGIIRPDGGDCYIDCDGKLEDIASINDAINKGIAYVPKERSVEGLILILSIEFNITLPILRKLKKKIFLFLDHENIKNKAKKIIEELQIKAPGLKSTCQNLSGGNQQKVVLAKWLVNNPRILILNDPTRGIDVGAREAIYRLLKRLTDKGISLIIYSNELSELLGMCDNLIALKEGQISASWNLAGQKNLVTEEEVVRSIL